MASEAQINYVTDLAIQTGILPVTSIDVCRAEVATWDHHRITSSITFLKSRLWRSRARATAKQVEYGNKLLEEITALTDTEVEELDFELMNSLQATEELTKLEAFIAFLKALDVDLNNMYADGENEPQSSPQARTEADLTDVFRAMAQQG